MSSVFLQLVNMSITAGWIVLAVLLLRLCLKKSPRWITCLLWSLVALRLLIPFQIESPLSLIPSAETVVSTETDDRTTIIVDSGIPAVDDRLNHWLTPSEEPLEEEPIKPAPVPDDEPSHSEENIEGENGETILPPDTEPVSGDAASPFRIETVLNIAVVVWLAGIFTMVLYEVVSALLVRRRVWDAVLLQDNVWQSDRIETPFILGFFRPRIYVPYGLEESSRELVLAHERAHIQRRDYWIKPFAFTLLAIYWYHPLLWIAYILLCRDIEVACDERVVRDLSTEQRRLYAAALLKCGTEHRTLVGCPLAFGELGIKQRIFSILRYKKPMIWVIVISLMVCGIATVSLLTVPQKAIAQGVIDNAPSDTNTGTTSSTVVAVAGSTTATSTFHTTGIHTTGSVSTIVNTTGSTSFHHTHSFGSWYIAVAPACESAGSRERACSCGLVEKESIPAVGHTYIRNVCVTCGDGGDTAFVPDYDFGQANTIGNEDGAYYVARQDDWLYYATDYRYITKSRVDGTGAKKVFSVTRGSILNINVVGDWIYFFVYTSTVNDCYIAKVRTDGSDFAYVLQSVEIGEMLVVKDKLFFTMLTNSYGKASAPLYMLPLNGGMTQQLYEGYVCHLASDGKHLYFERSPKTGNNALYRINLSTMQRSTVSLNYKGSDFILKNNYIYYTQKDDEAGDYVLRSICLQDGTVTVLGRPQYMTEWFAVIGNSIYYSGMSGSDSKFGIMELDPHGAKYNVIYNTGDAPVCIGLGDCLVWRDYSGEVYGGLLRIYNCSTARWTEVIY